MDEAGLQVGAWWIWNNLNCTSWLPDAQEFDNERMFFLDSNNGIYELAGKDDRGAAISSHVELHRVRLDHERTGTLREVRALASNKISNLTVDVRQEDELDSQKDSKTLSFVDANEKAPDSMTFGSSAFTEEKYRERKIKVRKTGQWQNIKISHSAKNERFKLRKVSAGFVPKGIR